MMERLNAPNQADSHVSAGGSVTFATRRLLGDICASGSRFVRDVEKKNVLRAEQNKREDTLLGSCFFSFEFYQFHFFNVLCFSPSEKVDPTL